MRRHGAVRRGRGGGSGRARAAVRAAALAGAALAALALAARALLGAARAAPPGMAARWARAEAWAETWAGEVTVASSARSDGAGRDGARGIELGTGAPLYGVHDPSAVNEEDGAYYVVSTSGWGTDKWRGDTGGGLRVYRSTDGERWHRLRPNALASHERGHPLWAPDAVRRPLGGWWIYYSVSEWGSSSSCVRLAWAPSLGATEAWEERGEVMCSDGTQGYNAIDPAAFIDGDGELWLVFGSSWQGIVLTRLDAATGLLRRGGDTCEQDAAIGWRTRCGLETNVWGALNSTAGPPVVVLARPPPPAEQAHKDTGDDVMVEAPYIHRHGGWYYLFANWGWCCQGFERSTYSVRVGRSRRVDGPYVDKDGHDMAAGGGTLMLSRTNAGAARAAGPGHVGVLQRVPGHVGVDIVSFSAYDRDAPAGAEATGARLELHELEWTADGWPSVPTWNGAASLASRDA